MNLPAGYTARPAARDDLDPLVALHDEWDLACFGESEGAHRVELLYDWGAPYVELERDTRVVVADDGTLAAYVLLARRDLGDRFEVYSLVGPKHRERGVGSAILGWAEDEARSRLAPGGRTRLWNGTGTPDAAGLRLRERNGYSYIRRFWQMLSDLDDHLETGPTPPDVVIRRNVAGVDDRDGHAALQEAFAMHFGFIPEPFDEWWARNAADPTFDSGLGFVAEAEGRIVGASVNGIIEGTGWVYELGVRPRWRGRGIGRALLRHSLAMFAADGIRVARLGVDTENETGAVELYRSVGMRPVREWRLFEKQIEAD